MKKRDIERLKIMGWFSILGAIILTIAFLLWPKHGDFTKALEKAISYLTPGVEEQVGPIAQFLLVILIVWGGIAVWSVFYGITEYFIRKAILEEGIKSLWQLIKIKMLKDHYIIAGGGKFGAEFAKLLHNCNIPYVIIEKDRDRVDELRSHNLLVIEGDALDERVLRKANIEKAKYFVAAMGSTENNVYSVVLVKRLNPNIKVVGRIESRKFYEVMNAAGADVIINPEEEGAKRLFEIIFGVCLIK